MLNSRMDLKLNGFKIFLLAFIPKLLILFIVLYLTNFNLDIIFNFSDANSYLLIVKNIVSNSRYTHSFDERAFPGWPIMIYLFSFLIETKWASLILGLLLSSLVPWIYFRITKNQQISIILCFFTPTFIVHSINGMSEPLYLFSILLSIFLFSKQKYFYSAILIGFAAIVRPTALFPWIGMFSVLFITKSWNKLAIFSLLSGLTVCFLFLFNFHFYKDFLRQFHSYSTLPNVSSSVLNSLNTIGHGSHFGMPFVNLVKATFILKPPVWKIIFIWSHVVAIFYALYLGIKHKVYAQNLGKIFFIWAFFNSIFIFSTGEYWAFYSFDRYFVWALPAYLYLAKDTIIYNRIALIVFFFLSFIISTFGSIKYFL